MACKGPVRAGGRIPNTRAVLSTAIGRRLRHRRKRQDGRTWGLGSLLLPLGTVYEWPRCIRERFHGQLVSQQLGGKHRLPDKSARWLCLVRGVSFLSESLCDPCLASRRRFKAKKLYWLS